MIENPQQVVSLLQSLFHNPLTCRSPRCQKMSGHGCKVFQSIAGDPQDPQEMKMLLRAWTEYPFICWHWRDQPASEKDTLTAVSLLVSASIFLKNFLQNTEFLDSFLWALLSVILLVCSFLFVSSKWWEYKPKCCFWACALSESGFYISFLPIHLQDFFFKRRILLQLTLKISPLHCWCFSIASSLLQRIVSEAALIYNTSLISLALHF